MNYTKDILSNEELSFLLEQLNQTKILTPEEAQEEWKDTHPYALNNGSGLNPTIFQVYNTENKTLNNWLSNKFSKNNIVETLYTMEYRDGDFSSKHKDFLRNVAIILLTDDFVGGNFLIEDVDVELNNLGECVILDGHKHIHEVTEITRGIRKVLVIFFKAKYNLL
jgi:predicted 2-oxoglutarate/Fe(II)-dependent dioxygenase YbiX